MSVARRNERQAQVGRAFIIACTAVLVATLSHMLAGGNTPTLFAVGASIVVAVPLTLLLTRRSFGVMGTFVAVALTQLLFHSLFVYLGTGGNGSREPLPAHAEHFGMVQEFVPVLPETAGPGVAMWFSHLVAAIVTVWVIRRGELALGRVAQALIRVFWPALTLTLKPATGPVLDVMRTQVHTPPSVHPSDAHAHRGPPAVMAHTIHH